MNENTDFTNYLNEQISELSESTDETTTEEQSTEIEIVEEEVIVGDTYSSSSDSTEILETYEIIAVDPEVLYEKIDNVSEQVGCIALFIMLYICWEFLGKFFHIRKEGDL